MATITEDYVSFETAKLLKEKGFDEPIQYFYKFDSKELYRGTVFTNTQIGDKFYNAPTLQMAMKWMREVHDILIIINKDIHILEGFKGYFFVIQSAKGESYAPASVGTTTKVYEDAVEAAIKYCLEHLI